MNRFFAAIPVFVLALAFGASYAQATSRGDNLSLIMSSSEATFQNYGLQISITPPAPTTDDVIHITASGVWGDSCVPRYQSHQISSNVIKIDAVTPRPPGTGCLEVITPWRFAIEVGPLAAATYTVEVHMPGDMRSTLLSVTPGSTSEGVVLYQGAVVKVTQVLSDIVVENISNTAVAIRVSWDGCDPSGTGSSGCDSFIDDWVAPGERMVRPIKNHYSVQTWAWQGPLVDSCDLPVVPPSPALECTPIKPPARLAIYYAWPSGVNTCAGDTECASDVFGQFDLVVFGDGLEHPSHGDHVKTTTIINNLEDGDTDVYGYIDLGVVTPAQNLDPPTIRAYVDEWADMGVSGIFFDNAGQGFGVTPDRLRLAVEYVHNHTQTLLVFVNAWEPDDVLSGATPLTRGDWYLAESHPVSNCQCADLEAWWEKSKKLDQYRRDLGVRVATSNTCDVGTCSDWPDSPSFRAALWATYLFGFDAFNFTYPNYSASGVGADHICPPPPFPSDIGTHYTGPFAGPVTIGGVTAYRRLTNRGVIYVFGGSPCSGEFLPPFTLYLPIIIRPPDVLYSGSALTVTHLGSEIQVENISNSPIAIRVSWDGCDPYGTCPPGCVDCFLDDNVPPAGYIRRAFKDHTSVQVWAWDTLGTLTDSCDVPVD
jgi:hypothetical protein